MRFADVHGEKIRVVLIVVVNLNDVAHLAAEGGSSEAAKDQHERARAQSFAKVKTIRSVERQ